jgi:hypothetical protein
MVSVTLPRLGASLATVHAWTQLPMPEAAKLSELITGAPVGALVDMDRPIDFALTVQGSRHPELQGALAAGVRDLEAAKASLADYKLVPGANGTLRILGLRKPAADSSEGGDERACELAPAYGPAATRLVCASDEKALAALGPWLTRGATRLAPPTADGHLELRMAPVKPLISSERPLLGLLLGTILGNQRGYSGIREAGTAAAGDLADFAMDLDDATLDLTLSDPGATATLNWKLSGSTSALGRVMTANADRNGPPPAVFWQMPADADAAFFDRGIDPKMVDRARELATKVLDDKLAEDGVKEGDRKALESALGAFLLTGAPFVYAGGVDLDAARKALAAEKAVPETGDRREANRVTAQAIVGWKVAELDEPAGPRIDALKALATTWGRVSAVYKAKGGRVVALRTAAMPKGVTLPKDTQHFVVEVPLGEAPDPKAKAKGTPKPLSIDLFVVPDGARSWIGAGGDAAVVAAKLSAAVAGSGDNLGSRADLAPMKNAVLGAGGFFDTRSLPLLAQQVGTFGGDSTSFAGDGDLLEGVSQLPHQGATPIPFSFTAPAASPGTAVGTLQIPRGTIDDIMVLALKYGL